MAKPEQEIAIQALDGAQLLPISIIGPNPYQPRGPIDSASIAEMVESVRTVGILQPLLVASRSGKFIQIAGHRRLAAAKEAGLKMVPCLAQEVEEKELIRYSLIENLQRKDLTMMEEARSIKQLMETQNLDTRKAAEVLGKSKTYVGDRIELLKLPGDLRKAVEQGILSFRKAVELLKVEDEIIRATLIEVGGEISIDKFRELIAETLAKHTSAYLH